MEEAYPGWSRKYFYYHSATRQYPVVLFEWNLEPGPELDSLTGLNRRLRNVDLAIWNEDYATAVRLAGQEADADAHTPAGRLANTMLLGMALESFGRMGRDRPAGSAILNPKMPVFQPANTCFYEAEFQLSRGNRSGALEFLRRSLALEPGWGPAQNLLNKLKNPVQPASK